MSAESLEFVSSRAVSAYLKSRRNRPLACLSPQSRTYLLHQKTGILTERFFYQTLTALEVVRLVEGGAHDAATSRYFVAQTSGKALAFEANPSVYTKFKGLNNSPDIDYRSLGLSDQVMISELNIPAHHLDDSSLESSLDKREDFQKYRQVKIQVETLDRVALEFVNEGNSALWIDVEGLGYKVLAGATRILSSPNLKVIYIEVQEEKLYYKNEKYASEIAQYLHKFGFVAIARDYPEAALFNLVFVKAGEIHRLADLTPKYWSDYSDLKVPLIRIYPLRDILSALKKRLYFSNSLKFNLFLDHFFSRLGSKSSTQSVNSRDIKEVGDA